MEIALWIEERAIVGLLAYDSDQLGLIIKQSKV